MLVLRHVNCNHSSSLNLLLVTSSKKNDMFFWRQLVGLFGLFVNRFMQKLLNLLSQNSVLNWHMGHEKNH